MSTWKDRIELIYDEAFDFIDQALTKIRALDKNTIFKLKMKKCRKRQNGQSLHFQASNEIF